MKIAIASDDKKLISHHFGKALGFVVFEIENNKVISNSYRENIGKNSGECGSCNHSAMINNIQDCDYVISYGMGQRIYNDLIMSKIIPLVTEECNVEEALNKLMNNQLVNRKDKLH
ncbi:MAG: NifB/NifX family molybdenum-iron cluster-binding protein [Candidatus Pacearchaeota archaeon]|jgi:predicted Fe-Mo cluster-binding NifX family protein